MSDLNVAARPDLADRGAVDCELFDVVIVGAGLSGIGAACHLQSKCSRKSIAIIEARDAIGGTWDLFGYPGIRSEFRHVHLRLCLPAVGWAQGDC